MGSPISRDFVISFRLNGEEIAKIDKVRDGTNRTRNDYSRSIIQGHLNLEISEPVKPVRLPPRKMPTYDRQQLSQILGQLGKIGSNINQIARHSNVTRNAPPPLKGQPSSVGLFIWPLMTIHPFNLKPRYAYNRSCVGHRSFSISCLFAKLSLMNDRFPPLMMKSHIVSKLLTQPSQRNHS